MVMGWCQLRGVRRGFLGKVSDLYIVVLRIPEDGLTDAMG